MRISTCMFMLGPSTYLSLGSACLRANINAYGELVQDFQVLRGLAHSILRPQVPALGPKHQQVVKQQGTSHLEGPAPLHIFFSLADPFLIQMHHKNLTYIQQRSVSPAVYILLYMCSAAVVLLTVCGNLLVIISVLHFKQFHTPTNMLLLSLAVSDFLVGALLMPPMLIWTIVSCWIFGRDFCISFLLIGGIIMTISIYNVALITVDRYLALSNPFLYMSSISRRTMCIVRKAAKVLGILVSVFLMCLLPFYFYSILSNVIEIQIETLLKVLVVVHLNSTINPVIYALFYPWFRRCVKLIITLQIFLTDSELINVLS
ncbi:hypothetical protein Q7C36_011113 [Tachysurus vachellii]|uniref:G-protein coupled receptors family 1 profile domain-containing protein n=1 Tax=Tachysurus vachellii TaxID=175792 RepID=A0AA88SUP2_TACVA|nr:hypothetical protein Q7C36_011113 [Tachysurus vachellii]